MGELDKSGFVDRLYKSTPVVAQREERPAAKPAGEEKTTLVSKPTPTSQAKATAISTKTAQPSPAPVRVTKGEEHTVKAGDTLSKLAEQYYGSAAKWEKIYEANREAIKNPNYVFIGQKITIPPA